MPAMKRQPTKMKQTEEKKKHEQDSNATNCK